MKVLSCSFLLDDLGYAVAGNCQKNGNYST